jgi:hypothetical protein
MGNVFGLREFRVKYKPQPCLRTYERSRGYKRFVGPLELKMADPMNIVGKGIGPHKTPS